MTLLGKDLPMISTGSSSLSIDDSAMKLPFLTDFFASIKFSVDFGWLVLRNDDAVTSLSSS